MVMEWVNIEDRIPEDGNGFVLVYNPNKDYAIICGMRLEEGAAHGVSIDFFWSRGVTHWMPLPKMPCTNTLSVGIECIQKKV